MKKVCLVTYMRSTEKFTTELIDIAKNLNNMFESFKCIIFTESEIKIDTDYSFIVEQIILGGTKYHRILNLLENDDSDFFLSVDNDIKADMDNLTNFVSKVVKKNYDIGWGKIAARARKELVPNLVAVDKMLSHNIIRPLLWRNKIGISIPGQCFMIKKNTFKNKLMEVDTFLDDLALGLYVHNNYDELHVLKDNHILGYEIPNETFFGLLKQRERWALGYLSILKGVQLKKEFELVIIHGISYHGLWILNWLVGFIIYYFLGSIATLLYLLGVSFLITKSNLRLTFYGVLYQIIFPIFHIKWFNNLLKGFVK